MNLAHVTTRAQLLEAVENFADCPLKNTAENTVFSDGNPHAKIMVIGEAPGREEDEHGKPFIGRSGQLLDKLFGEVGLNRAEHLYVTNVMFWRPPDNRVPTPKELASVRPFIEKHIEIMQPKLLVLVGSTAMKFMLKSKEGITKIHGTWQGYAVPTTGQIIPAMPLYHPAYLLRNPPATVPAQQDLRTLRQTAVKMGLV